MNEGNFKILLILSEIVITAIAFIGAFLIFKPLFNKNKSARDKQSDKPARDTRSDKQEQEQ